MLNQSSYSVNSCGRGETRRSWSNDVDVININPVANSFSLPEDSPLPTYEIFHRSHTTGIRKRHDRHLTRYTARRHFIRSMHILCNNYLYNVLCVKANKKNQRQKNKSYGFETRVWEFFFLRLKFMFNLANILGVKKLVFYIKSKKWELLFHFNKFDG